jgi:hypothetical protein
MPLSPQTVIDPPTGPGSRRAPVWLPWLLAPAFLLLPIGGCGAAAALRQPNAPVAAAAPQRPLPGPVATVMTVAQPSR